jgi:NAD(P)-dependent dehydrogenase (short-subunit alcohol dehydrogenase family)
MNETPDPAAGPVAIVTGASQGLGLAVARELVTRGWRLVVDARRAERLTAAVAQLTALPGPAPAVVVPVAGDVADPDHRRALLDAAATLGPVHLIVNNASTLGASPLPALSDVDAEILRRTLDVNVVAPLALVAEARDRLAPGAAVVNVTSDAGVEAYEGWGVYGASKAALEHASRVLAQERPDLRVLVVDPGDMRTEMHQDAFPGEDISDRPPPDRAAQGLVALVLGGAPSGRYAAVDAAPAGDAASTSGTAAVS